MSPMRSLGPAHLIPLDLSILVIGEEHKLRSSTLCNYLQSPVTSTLVRILSIAPCSQIVSIYVLSIKRETKYHTHSSFNLRIFS
jgi:hypothetical protein